MVKFGRHVAARQSDASGPFIVEYNRLKRLLNHSGASRESFQKEWWSALESSTQSYVSATRDFWHSVMSDVAENPGTSTFRGLAQVRTHRARACHTCFGRQKTRS